MDRRSLLIGLAATVLGSRPAWADVSIGIKVRPPLPPPPPVVVAPAPVVVAPPPPPPPVVMQAPQVVIVPGSAVYYAPGVGFNLFVYGGRYYSFHNGVWFYSRRHSGPWKTLPAERVPRPVRVVPVKYYRVPPGHAKRRDWSPGPPGHRGRGWDGDGPGKKHRHHRKDRD